MGTSRQEQQTIGPARLFAVLLFGCITFAGSAQIAINATPTAPNSKSILDLVDPARGLLLPRMTRAERVLIVAPAPANSLLVYQTDDFTPAPPALPEPKGLWYRDGANWVRVGTSPAAWQLGGNAGTNPATNFLGTTDAVDLSIRTNGVERIRVLGAAGPAQGFVGINQAAPNERLEVSGAMRVNGTTATANAGDVRLNPTTNAHDGYSDNGPSYPTSGLYQLENVFGSRVAEGYVLQAVGACLYPTSTTNVLAAPRNWPIIDNPAYPNLSSFGTLESPYSTFWEDGRHQFLYLSADLQTLGICAGTNITGAAFQALNAGPIPITYSTIRMKNTPATTLPTMDLVGLTNCASPPSFTPVAGWNTHNFNTSPFQWTGPGFSVIMEFSIDCQQWSGQAQVQSETTPFASNSSVYCDACGHQFTMGSSTCAWSAGCGPPPGGVYPPTTQLNAATPLCLGWGHTGGPNMTMSSSLITCDGTFTWNGATTGSGLFKRPILALYAQNLGTGPTIVSGNYLVAQQGVMIGTNAWSTGGVFPNQNLQGPGTISAQKAVFSNNVFLSDHVFDRYFDGQVRPEDAAAGKVYTHMPIAHMANYVEKERHLPTIDGRERWESNGAFSVDQVTNQMWVTVEAQALYIKELNERAEALRKYLVEKRLKELQKP